MCRLARLRARPTGRADCAVSKDSPVRARIAAFCGETSPKIF